MTNTLKSIIGSLHTVHLKQGEFVGSVDAGTTSVRFIVFDSVADIIAEHQLEFPQYFPHPGWHEHDPLEIMDTIYKCIEETVKKLEHKGWDRSSIKAIGITNQRETTVAWSRETHQPLCRAIVWDDARTKGTALHYERKLREEGIKLEDGTVFKGDEGIDKLRDITGLPISTYFSAIKLHWMLEHHPSVQEAHTNNTLLFGTIDSWIVYNLTLSPSSSTIQKPLHITDPTNASRSLLLSLSSLTWSQPLLQFFSLNPNILPTLRSSSEPYAPIAKGRPLEGTMIAGIVGDQQAALVGNKCLMKGEAKNTYGTGAFLLFNTGTEVVKSRNGLIGTVAYQAGPKAKPYYALEGSIAVAGSAIKWLRDQLHLISSSSEISTLAAKEEDTGGLYFVTAFSGLLAPYWDSSAGGVLIGLTQYTTPSHIARATLEAAAFHTRAVLEAMKLDCKESLGEFEFKELKVDGGMTNGDLCMQIQADLGGFKVVRPEMRESTALGSALLAGSALHLFGWDVSDPSTLSKVNVKGGDTLFKPSITEEEREKRWKGWKKAVERSRGWEEGVEED